ncbi:hypothetical protein SAMN05446037_1008162 [Anaerovirgula multivorans]|uniref:Uncharacterized protein n=1 Tax=Anaerovirgula multivorans TaxID=312168 RepID=A0A239DXP3_9FIRM|nr:hypothetical protein [Anaerovirgula multivorans]SNS36492.1 hypothetical protein SAMN05446037_1008162 [Anaerovirgula multivorans]
MRKATTFILMFCILATPTFAHANAGPTYWKGYPSSGILTIEENSSIEVEKEDLIFDFTRDEYLDHNYYSISSRVTAKYTMSNYTENRQTVQMAFPFISHIQNFNPEAIDIKVNNEKIPFEVFIGNKLDTRSRGKDNKEQLDFSSIVKSISSSEYTPTNYNLDEIGTLYTYDVVSIGEDELSATIDYTYDHEKSRIMSKGFNGYQIKDGTESIIARIRENEEFEIFLLGQDVEFNFNAYSDVELTNKTDQYSLDIRTQEVSMREYLTKEIEIFKNKVNYLDYLADNQIFNLSSKLLDELIEQKVVNLGVDEFFLIDGMERFFVLIYVVDFQPHSTNDVSVSYNSRGTMDKTKTAEPLYTFDYILNPAKNWASFNNLNIEIRPPAEHPYIIDSSVNLVRKEDGTYTGSFESLPEVDLSFSLYYNEEITTIDKIKGFLSSNSYLFMASAPWLLGALIGFIIKGIYSKLRKLKEN